MLFTIAIMLAGICLFRSCGPSKLDGRAATYATANAVVRKMFNRIVKK
jgi:hypothetical protein